MIVTDDESLYQKMKHLRSQGVDPNKRYWHSDVGYNYRMTNLQAAVGLAQLENIDWHLMQRKRVAELYNKYLSQLGDVVTMQYTPAEANHVHWMLSIMLSADVTMSRDEVMNQMERKNIEMRPLFYPMHHMPPYLDETLHLPITESLSARGINLPTHAMLSEDDIAYIVSSLKEVLTMVCEVSA